MYCYYMLLLSYVCLILSSFYCLITVRIVIKISRGFSLHLSNLQMPIIKVIHLSNI